MATKIKGLQQWCRRMTDGYANVDIANFTTAWRDGMAFCALIHRFRPDLIDYDSLSPENVFDNCKLAFEVAEKELDIPAFLEAEDMAQLKAPDKLSVITYVSQYYNFLSPLPQLGGPGVRCKVSNKSVSGTKRRTDSDNSYAPTTKRAPVTETKENATLTAAGDLCAICQKRVYLLERHMEGGKLYHRSCFRHSELSPTNKVYTRSPYLSPSLKSETPSFIYPSTNSGSSVLSEIEKSSKDSKHQVTAGAEPSHLSKRSEGVGTKHMLSDLPRENTKKSRPLSEASLDEEKLKRASALKDRLHNLKAQYSVNKSTKVENVLPLSGKEARKLERKREELLTSRKPHDEPVKSAKHNRPHILQQSDRLTSDASKNDLPASTSSSPAASLKVTARTSAPISISYKESTPKPASVLVSSKLDSHVAFSRNMLSGGKTSDKVITDKLKTNILTTRTLSDAPKFSGKSGMDSKEPHKPGHPVAKPRTVTHKSAGTGATEDDVSNRPALTSLAGHTNTEIIPKPAPRRSTVENLEKTFLEQPKLPQRKKHILHSESAIEEVDSSRVPPADNVPEVDSSRVPPAGSDSEVDSSKVPPAGNVLEVDLSRVPPAGNVPKVDSSRVPPADNVPEVDSSRVPPAGNIPPLPASAPPPLPVTDPVGEITLLTNKDTSKPTNELIPQEAESSLHGKTHSVHQEAVSLASVPQEPHREAVESKTTILDEIRMNHSNRVNTESTSALASVRSEATDGDEAVASISASSYNRRWSPPISVNEHQNVLNIVPAGSDHKNEVHTDPSKSLSIIKDNTSSELMSTGSTMTAISSPSLPSALVPASETLPIRSNATIETRFIPSSESSNETISLNSPSLNILSPLEPVAATIAPSTQQISTTVSNVANFEKLDSNSCELQVSQNLSDNSIETSRPRALSRTIISENSREDSNPRSSAQTVTCESSETSRPRASSLTVTHKNNNEISRPRASSLTVTHKNNNEISRPRASSLTVTHKNNNEISRPRASSLTITFEGSSDTSEPRASSLAVICENSTEIFESKSLLNDTKKDTENKSENLDLKSDYEENSFYHTPAEQSIIIDESKNTSSMEQSALSFCKEDLEFNLNCTIPDPKKVREDTGTLTSNIDAIKDQVEYEITPQKPPRLSKLSKTINQDKHANLHKVKENDGKKKPYHKLDPSVCNLEAVEVVQAPSLAPANKSQPDAVVEKADTTIEMPQWKKDIEERKKKLREDIAKSESENVKLKHLREKGARKVPKNPDFVAQREDTSETQNTSCDTELLPEKHISPLSLETESTKDNEIKNVDNKGLSESEINYDRLNLQQEAEKRKVLLSCSDNRWEDNKESGEPKRVLSKISDNADSYRLQKESRQYRYEGLSLISDITKEHSKKRDVVAENSTTADRIIKRPVKLKDSELEFVVSKTKLKSVEVDIDISSTEESGNMRAKGNRDFLQQVSKTEDVSIGVMKTYNGTDNESGIKISPANNETNNHSIASTDSSHVSDMQHIQKLSIKRSGILKSTNLDNSEKSEVDENERKHNSSNKPVLSESICASGTKQIQKLNINESNLLETVDLRGSDKNKGNESGDEGNRRVSVFSEEKLVLQTGNMNNIEDKDKKTSPKMKRKITVLGRSSKDSAKSEPSSPLPMRKIEVNTKFNFEESSSDFEISLTDSAAKLTIHDKNAPPPRPPPPRSHHKTVPPLQISAIELQQQLLDIDGQLTDLELRGRDLEESIRNENTLEDDDDGVINEWFRLVSERNDLVRKEADLVYISRQQDLEDEQEHIESQLRYLISKPDGSKSAEEKQEEEYLIKRKLELVEQRNKIVTSMDEDRMRYETEDKDIKMMREKGLWRTSSGQVGTVKEKRISKSVFYS